MGLNSLPGAREHSWKTDNLPTPCAFFFFFVTPAPWPQIPAQSFAYPENLHFKIKVNAGSYCSYN